MKVYWNLRSQFFSWSFQRFSLRNFRSSPPTFFVVNWVNAFSCYLATDSIHHVQFLLRVEATKSDPRDIWCLIRKICYFNIQMVGFETSAVTLRLKFFGPNKNHQCSFLCCVFGISEQKRWNYEKLSVCQHLEISRGTKVVENVVAGFNWQLLLIYFLPGWLIGPLWVPASNTNIHSYLLSKVH